MKKILLFALVSLVVVSSCRRKENNVSLDVTVSYPQFHYPNGKYFSIKVGYPLPAVTAIATAYDTFYKQACPVVVNFNAYSNKQTGYTTTGVDNKTPGLYTASISSKNQFGFTNYDIIYVGVTNIPDTMNLSGLWYDTTGTYPLNRIDTVTKVATGMFTASNIYGADVVSDAADVYSGLFLVLDPNTIVFAPATLNITGNSAVLNLPAFDTNMVYTTTQFSAAGTSVTYKKLQ